MNSATTMTPELALTIAKAQLRDKSAKKHGLIVTGNDYEVSLLCNAARHVGLQIISVKQGDAERELTRADWLRAQGEWQTYINGQKTWRLTSVLKTSSAAKADKTDALGALIGLDKVKSQVRDVIALKKVEAKRQKSGLAIVSIGQHLVFTGNPGTGKTTVARIIGDIYRDIGILEKGQFIEIDGRGLIADYLGQTAGKVREVVAEALGGVLFIDEAYALNPTHTADEYGREAIATLIKLMEDHRDELVVILAGYEAEMEALLDSNPGLKSRFKTKIQFEDYNADELYKIFEKLCADHQYQLNKGASIAVKAVCDQLHARKGKHFGNGRTVRNFFERCLVLQARRLCNQDRASKKDLQTFIQDDIPECSTLEW